MNPAPYEVVPQNVLFVYRDVCKLMELLPKITLVRPAYLLGIRIPFDVAQGHMYPDCHIVSRVLSSVLPLEAVDGHIVCFDKKGTAVKFYHSWLVPLLPAKDERYIIDAWPIGAASGPALVVRNGYSLPYEHGEKWTGLKEKKNRKLMFLLASAMREARDKLEKTG